MEKRIKSGAAILMDIQDGRIIDIFCREILLGDGRPVGSVLKLFTVAALLESGADGTAVYYCKPSSPEVPSTSACWYRPGHGNMTLRTALAHSCNAYFRQWLQGKDMGAAERLFTNMNLTKGELPCREEVLDALLGFTPVVRPRPVDLACAVAALLNGGVYYSALKAGAGERCSPSRHIKLSPKTIAVIKEGMRECARLGTGRAAQEAVGVEPILAKTGTSPHWTPSGVDPLRTDGWCVVLYPAEEPRVLLLVLVNGSTGAEEAADGAGEIMREYIERHVR